MRSMFANVDPEQLVSSSIGGAIYVVQAVWCSRCGANYMVQYAWGGLLRAIHVVQSTWCNTCCVNYVVEHRWCKLRGAIYVMWQQQCGAIYMACTLRCQITEPQCEFKAMRRNA
eukprot:8094642-Pyramimonas_sp.AAC.2